MYVGGFFNYYRKFYRKLDMTMINKTTDITDRTAGSLCLSRVSILNNCNTRCAIRILGSMSVESWEGLDRSCDRFLSENISAEVNVSQK